MAEPTARGILAFDLTPPGKPLALAWEPLRHPASLSAAEQNAARRAASEREERLRQAGEAAVDDWTAFQSQHAKSPITVAALNIHQPVVEYDRVVCQECMEHNGYEDTQQVEWPCPTYAAMKAAADG